jgi:hypothetical protein
MKTGRLFTKLRKAEKRLLEFMEASVGFLLGYSIPPFIHAGVFSDREEKGVEVVIDEDMEKFYEDLYKNDDDE